MTEMNARKSLSKLARSEFEDCSTVLPRPGFGTVFTDHMIISHYSGSQGWSRSQMSAYSEFRMPPSSLVFHYAQAIFEGLKAYRLPDGGAAIFRPQAHAKRFRNSARRLAMAELPEESFLNLVKELVRADHGAIPDGDKAALYLRPFQIGDEAVLGIRPSNSYLFCAVASPASSYFSDDVSALTLWATRDYSRAGPGGTGDVKCGGNYAASLAAQAEAMQQGCDQAVFLDAVERRYVEELGGMNIFFVFDDGSIQTPPLSGTILPGVTRDSLIVLAKSLGFVVREERYALDQWQRDAKSGRLCEAFACGTAAVVAAIGAVRGHNHGFQIGDGGMGPITEQLWAALVAIQRGVATDHYGWLERVV